MVSDESIARASLLAAEAAAEGDAEVILARQAAATTAASHAAIADDHIVVFDPEHESLVYGPASEIQFGPRGGNEPHVWIGPRVIGSEEYNLVDKMMTEHPRMFELGVEKKVIACGDCMAAGVTPNEFKSLQSFRMHRLSRHGGAVKDLGIDQG